VTRRRWGKYSAFPNLCLGLLGLTAATAYAQSGTTETAEVEVLPVQGNVYMLAGDGGNVTIQVGRNGVLLVDTQYAHMTDKILAAIRKLSDQPIRYVINTSVDGDHTGGNDGIARTGALPSDIPLVNTPGATAKESVQILAHLNVLNRMSVPPKGQAPAPSSAWPTDTYAGNEKELYFNGEGIQMIHIPAAHSDGDTLVYFRRSDVISAGDLFLTTGYPVIDLERGGSLQGVIAGLNRILDLAIPAHHEEGGTYVVPGHGRLCDEFDVLEYRDMVTIVRDRIQAMIRKGMTLDEVKAARPTRDYDPRYGATSGPWTTAMFVEAAYRSLKKN
jgi:glyoxylase-like metal-dependent hydrolase (beta-lactamase superfamily II)